MPTAIGIEPWSTIWVEVTQDRCIATDQSILTGATNNVIITQSTLDLIIVITSINAIITTLTKDNILTSIAIDGVIALDLINRVKALYITNHIRKRSRIALPNRNNRIKHRTCDHTIVTKDYVRSVISSHATIRDGKATGTIRSNNNIVTTIDNIITIRAESYIMTTGNIILTGAAKQTITTLLTQDQIIATITMNFVVTTTISFTRKD